MGGLSVLVAGAEAARALATERGDGFPAQRRETFRSARALMAKMMILTSHNSNERPATPNGKPMRAMLTAPDLKQALKAFGPGWQILTNGGLREAVRRHHLPSHVAAPYHAAARERTSFER